MTMPGLMRCGSPGIPYGELTVRHCTIPVTLRTFYANRVPYPRQPPSLEMLHKWNRLAVGTHRHLIFIARALDSQRHVGKRFWLPIGFTLRTNGISNLVYSYFSNQSQTARDFLITYKVCLYQITTPNSFIVNEKWKNKNLRPRQSIFTTSVFDSWRLAGKRFWISMGVILRTNAMSNLVGSLLLFSCMTNSIGYLRPKSKYFLHTILFDHLYTHARSSSVFGTLWSC